MKSSIHRLIDKQQKNRMISRNIPAIKINLYRNYEVYAVKDAIDNLGEYSDFMLPDCFMVGDSLLTTHLRRSNTRLSSNEGQELFLGCIINSIAEVKTAINDCFRISPQPYLMGDLPFGSTKSGEHLIRISKTMLEYGADVVKLEVFTSRDLRSLELLSKNDIPVVAHIGYTPQKSENRQYGISFAESVSLMRLAQEVRDCGACALVVERICEIINQALCTPSRNSLPVYSIFSGKARYGGQSLNVWDSVYKPSFKNHYFPPTALFDSNTYPKTYTHETIKKCFTELLKATLENKFPKSPPNKLSPEHVTFIQSINPWTHSFDHKEKHQPKD
jgi:ketopantoate hydroxymethyltransferase